MDDVLWHSATRRFSKSILVKMPRLPTILVIGSQFISTRFPFFWGVCTFGAVMVLIEGYLSLLSERPGPIAGGQLGARMPPLGFLVHGVVGECAETADRLPVNSNAGSGHFRARRLIHERHEFVGEPGHGAADADSAHVGTAADAGHPSAFGHVAIDDGAPASQLHDALGRSV